MNGFLFFLFIMTLATSGNCAVYTCDSRKPCVLKDVVLESEFDLNLAVFPDVNDPLTIASGKIPHFTRGLAEKLSKIVDLTMNGVQCETLFIAPEMVHVEAKNNIIHTLLVDNDVRRKYELLSLNLTSNRLTDVAVLQRFTKLRVLNINENKLDRLSTDTFAEMKELRHVSLANNYLQSIETDRSFQLLKLRYLSLAKNKLTELNIEKWDLPSLEELDLSGNNFYLMSGGLQQFNKLQAVRVSGNYWKCEYWLSMLQSSKAQFDTDRIGRCSEEGLLEERNVCCQLDASNFLGGSYDFGMLNEKWEELRVLQETVKKLSDSLASYKEQTNSEWTSRTTNLEDRLRLIENEQRNLMKRLEEKESQVALDETEKLKTVVTDHKSSITNLEEKQSELSSELESFVERLNEIRESVTEESSTMASFRDKVEVLERALESLHSSQSAANDITRLVGAVRQLEGQQLKNHLSSVDLKNQIKTERERIEAFHKHFAELERVNQLLRNEVSVVHENVRIAFKILDEISLIDE
ncbi:uncharacterized protein LOC128737229 [Sabethes cyaneus]|uniref:uncharacterized protein LOC128737229 n=1 Tax=Sabethes cyaneus TaxID=53552 RepID=UPI00237D5DA0|nr:uncharacterized protein LOC128737229 [Sabethes cyaneus]